MMVTKDRRKHKTNIVMNEDINIQNNKIQMACNKCQRKIFHEMLKICALNSNKYKSSTVEIT